MTIEIHKPELAALIRRRMGSGEFQELDDLPIKALKAGDSNATTRSSQDDSHRRSLFEWMDKAGAGWNLEDHPELARGALINGQNARREWRGRSDRPMV